MKIFKPHFIKIIFLAFILLIVSPPVQARKNINPARKVSTRMMSENSHRSNSIKERMRAMTPEESVRDRVIFYDSAGYQTEEEIRRFCISSLQNGTTFEGKVSGCPQLAHQIVWQRPDGSKVDFERWSPSQKVRINELFDRINRNERDLGVRCPRPEDGVNVELRRIYISENEAFDMYAASVAQAIYIESNNLVPWSLRNNPPAENEAILDSSQYFSIITSDGLGSLSVVRRRFSPGTSYRLPAWHYASEALSCDPRVPYNFLSGLNSSTHTTLIQSNQRDTIKALSLWFHKNAFHDPNPPTYFPSFDEWVRDFIFLESRLARRTSGIGETAAQGILMRKGCHGAANLFLELARGINIPIRIFWYADQPFVSDTFNYAPAHMGIAFHWTQPDYKVVIHADDLYVQNKEFFPIQMSAPMSSVDSENAWMDQIWLSPDQLERWGIRFFRDLPLQLPGQDISRTRPPRPDSVPHDGYLGGYAIMRNTMTGIYPSLSVKTGESGYQLCGWNEFVNYYCADTSTGHLNFYGQMYTNANLNYPYMVPSLPFMRTADDYVSRVEECIMANGGCDAMRAVVGNHNREHGSNYYIPR